MAKFKVGDKVDVVGTKMRNKIVSKIVYDHGISSMYELKGVPMVAYLESRLTPALNPNNSCASSNPVVANALAATGVARNADNPFKVGDIVSHKAFPSDIKFKVVAVTNDLQGNSAVKVEVFKGGFMDSPVRFKKA